MKPNRTLTRRTVLKQFAAAGAAFSLLPYALRGDGAPSNRVHVAMIGTGRQGTYVNLRTFLGMPDVRVVAVCDVDRQRAAYAKGLVDEAYGTSDCKACGDFREAMDHPDLDAVMISSPDHWHAIQALHALDRGLHVCCEKALTRYFDESRAMADRAQESGLVFRTDTECRSNAYMIKTANLAINGYLGRITRMEVGVPPEGGSGFGDPTPAPVPAHLDYEMWQGPAAERPYAVDRVHRNDPATGKPAGRPGWLRISDYCAGMICNWGAHLMDVANLCNGTSRSGPVACEGTGRFPDDPDALWDTIIGMDLHYTYADGVRMHYRIDKPYLRLEGEDGWIQAHWHSKGGLQAHDRNIFRTEFKDGDRLVATRSDKRDFIDAITRGSPVMIDAEAGHRVHTQCMLGLAAIRAGRRLEWDPETERITNDPEAEAYLKQSRHRAPWNLKKFL